ncbi:MAG: EamA family transporter, partial [Nitrososphaeria archaeon]
MVSFFFSLLGCITNSKIDSILASMFFFFAGVFSPGLVRYTYYRGIFYLGAALNASIFAMWPLFAFVLSILLLRETSTIGTYLGGIVIVVGIILLYLSMNKEDIGRANPKYTLSSFLAAIFAAIATVLRKEGLNIQPDPILGVWIGYLAATLTSFAITPKDLYKLIFKIPKKLFLAGFCLCFAWLTFFYALKFGDASTVSALMNLEAIFIVFFSKIFLRAYEKVG